MSDRVAPDSLLPGGAVARPFAADAHTGGRPVMHRDNHGEACMSTSTGGWRSLVARAIATVLVFAGSAVAPMALGAPPAAAQTSSPDCPATTPSQAAGSPSAPTGVHAIAGNGSATVTWCSPVSGQGSVTGYTVTASNGATGTARVPEDFFIMDGLTNGQSYTFTVRATTSSSSGPSSSASNTVTADPIPAPSGVTLGTAQSVTYDQHSVMVGGQRVFLYAAEFEA